ncbi:MAG TPA: ThiF family adenylyltransferase [Saprospiraceae bacterium]|nr:ThiF family adenylyltransferase [Saprospiraceae bacterium]
MIHWFKKHPQYLIDESTALSNDNNYKELYQVRENLFLSHGNIIVRLDKIYRFPILVVYTEATPYALPLIYPLNKNLSFEELEELAKTNLEELEKKILSFVEFYYHLRHQNQTGNLCIIEWDNLDDGFQFYGIKNILSRVRDWFSGIITGNFPLDSQEVSFFAHFNNINNEFRLLYNDIFLNEDLVEGEIYGILFNYISKDRFHTHDRWTYFGCIILGKNKQGIYENINCMLPNSLPKEGINTIIDLIHKKEKLTNLIIEHKVLKSFWFQILKEPQPFKTLNDLIIMIGDGDYKAGLRRLKTFYFEELILQPNSFIIAIRFPNRKGIQEFQLFKVLKKSHKEAKINTSEEELFEYIVEAYELVEAIYCEKFTDSTFHERNQGCVKRDILINKTINIVGVGALGSEITDSLGKAGVGKLNLFDNQEMNIHNPVRHVCGLDTAGIPKVVSVAETIFNHNPFVDIFVGYVNINSIDLNNFFPEDSITISSIADDNTEGYLNERAIISNKVVYYARALRGAKVGRIFRVIPGKDACFHCLNLYRNENREFIIIPDDEDLPTLRNECNNPIRPASAADLKLISALTSRILLDEIQQGYGENNHWIWSTESIEPLQPFQMHSQFIASHPKCYYCNHDKKVDVVLPTEIESEMKDLILKNPKVETGGVLAGKIDTTGNFVITNASGPGPNAIHSATKFEKDKEFCQKFLDDLFLSSNKEIVYIGEWHSHPNENNNPSNTDIKSLSEISFQKEYLTDIPIMIIFTNTGIPSCTIHPAGKRFYFATLKKV